MLRGETESAGCLSGTHHLRLAQPFRGQKDMTCCAVGKLSEFCDCRKAQGTHSWKQTRSTLFCSVLVLLVISRRRSPIDPLFGIIYYCPGSVQKQGATTVAAKSTAGKKRGDAKRAARPNSDNTPRGPAASSPRAPSNTAPTVHRHNKTKQSQVQHSSAPTEDLLGIFSDAGASTSSTYGPAAGKLSADIMDLFSVDSNNTSYASIHAPAGSVDANAGQDLISRPDAVAKPAADSSAEKTVDFSRERASVGNGDSRAPATSTTATSNDDTQLPATSTAGIVDSGFKTFVTSNTSASARVDSKPASTSTAATVNSDSQTPVTSTVQTPVAVLVIPPDKIEGEMLRGWTRTNSPVGDIHKRTTAATVGRGGGGGNSTNNERSRASNSNNPSRVSSDAVDTQKGVTTVLSFEASGAADRVADRFSEDTRAMAAAGKGGERGPVLWAEAALQRCQGDEELAVEFVEIRTAIEMEAFVLGDDAEKRLRDESEEMERHRVWFWQVCFCVSRLCLSVRVLDLVGDRCVRYRG